jgi:outer membrane protein assembly factor BamB
MNLSHPRFRPERTIPDAMALPIPRRSVVRLRGVKHLPVVLGDRLIVPLEEGRIVAYRTPSWDLLWQTPAPGPTATWDLRLIVDGSDLFFTCASTLFRCDRETGRVSPVRPVHPECDLDVDVLCDGRLYRNASLMPGQMQLSCESLRGEQLWTANLSPVMRWSACDADVFVCSQVAGPLIAFDCEAGRVLWEQPQSAAGWPLIADGRVYFASAHRLHCVHAADGSTIWSVEIPIRSPANLNLHPDGRLYVIDGGHLCVVTQESGTIIRTHSIERACERLKIYTPSDAFVTDGLIWTGDARSGAFAAFSVDSGEAVWSTQIGAPLPFLNVPFAAANEVLVLAGNGDLLGFGQEAGG